MKRERDTCLGYYQAEACQTDEFRALITQNLRAEDVPNATHLEKNVPIYDAVSLGASHADPSTRRALMAEWAWLLHSGPGAFVIKQAQPDHAAISAATAVFLRIIADEKADGGEGADHFAAAGSNDRIWNALQKLCLADPDVFVRYFAAPALDTACEAWLGPGYQMTAQVNLVHPGGQAQQAHRDYHLGFQTAEVSARYPAHVHDLSPLMTLQGGIAHCDIPVESGATRLLPFSQLYRPGYAAWRREDFRTIFEDNMVQIPLQCGDALFFSPALFHAAGENRSASVERMVNLLQVSSPFGRAMENVDRSAMCRAVYAPLCRAWSAGEISKAALNAAVAATAEGYAFPTNLDRDPPTGGLAPQSQANLLATSVRAGLAEAEFLRRLMAQAARRAA